MKLNTFIITTITILTLTSVNLHAAGKGKVNGIMKQLDLSQEQRASLKEVRKTYSRAQIKENKKQIKTKREELKNAMLNNGSDGQLKSLHQEIQNLKNSISNLRFEKLMKVRSILTSEQRIKFHKLRSEKRKNRKGRNKSKKSHF